MPATATTIIGSAIVIDQAADVPRRLKGRVCHQLERTDEVFDTFRRAIRLYGTDAFSINNMGMILIEADRVYEALRPLTVAVELRDNVTIFHNNLLLVFEYISHIRTAEDA